MLRFCGTLASSSARAVALRNFATSAVRKDSQPDSTAVDRLFNDESQPKRRGAICINRIELLGGVGDDPTARVSRNGAEYVTFNLFTNVDFRRGDGSYGEHVEMHNIHCFGKLGNNVRQSVSKGSRVMVVGRLHYEGGTVRPDGTRSPKIASITADNVFPISRFNKNE